MMLVRKPEYECAAINKFRHKTVQDKLDYRHKMHKSDITSKLESILGSKMNCRDHPQKSKRSIIAKRETRYNYLTKWRKPHLPGPRLPGWHSTAQRLFGLEFEIYP